MVSSSTRSLIFLLLAVCWTSQTLHAQDTISSDRPGIGDGSAVMTPLTFQLEGGYGYTEDGGLRVHSIGQLLARFGLVDGVEMRLGLNSYLLQRGSAEAEGLEDLTIGFKGRLVRGDGTPGGVPSVSLLVLARIPSGANAFTNNAAEPEARLAFDWPATARQTISANLGIRSVDFGAEQGRIINATLTWSASIPGVNGGSVYAGYGGSYPASGDAAHALEAGVAYLLNNDTQVDLNSAFGIGGPQAALGLGLGIARRF